VKRAAGDRIATIADAEAVLARAGAMTIVPTKRAVPSLVVGVTGGPVRGSWWAHPKGKLVFRIATELEASGRALGAKLVEGKVTLLARALWPALVRVTTDRAWRTPRIAALAADPRALFDQVEQAGELHGEDAALRGKAFTAARRALEDALLVHAASEHTARGHHAAVLSSWTRWCPPDVARAARAMPLDDAHAALAAALGAPLR
jgi:hypothetical protein